MANSTPQPIVQAALCSMCGLDWKRHKVDPESGVVEAAECVRLLLIEGLKPTPVVVPPRRIGDTFPHPWVAPGTNTGPIWIVPKQDLPMPHTTITCRVGDPGALAHA
jgi:hypothetical protein